MNPYKVLGISENSSSKEIKQAFRKMALTHHPDKSKDNGKMFIQINKAYCMIKNKKDKPAPVKFNDLFSHFFTQSAEPVTVTIDIRV